MLKPVHKQYAYLFTTCLVVALAIGNTILYLIDMCKEYL